MAPKGPMICVLQAILFRMAPPPRKIFPVSQGKYLRDIMPLMNATFSLGKCKEYIDTITDKDEKNIAMAEYYYYTGNVRKCADIAEKYIDSDIFELRTSALWLYAFSNLSIDRPSYVRKALKQIKLIYENTSESSPNLERAISVCLYDSVYVQFSLLKPKDLPPSQNYLRDLPPGLRLFIVYNHALYAFSKSLYGVAVGIAETVLALDDIKYPIPTLYLHLVCAMSYMHMGYTDISRRHILEAWRYAKADGFIEPLGEAHGLLCGMLEATFKKSETLEFRKMIKIAKQYSTSWTKIHNEITGDTIPLDLTPNEYVMCMLVARGWHSKDIATHLGITANAVHKTVSDAMSKMGVTKRADIKKIMLLN